MAILLSLALFICAAKADKKKLEEFTGTVFSQKNNYYTESFERPRDISSTSSFSSSNENKRIVLIPTFRSWFIPGYDCGYQMCSYVCVDANGCFMRCKCKNPYEFAKTDDCKANLERVCKRLCFRYNCKNICHSKLIRTCP